MERIRRLFILQPQRGGRDRSTDIVLGEILREVQQLRKEVKKMQQQIQDALASLQTEVGNIRDTEQAAVTLIQGLQTQLNDALNSSSDPSEVVAAVQAITNQLGSDAAPLAAAVANQNVGGGAGAPSGGTDTGSGSDTSGTDTGSGSDTGSGDATDPTA